MVFRVASTFAVVVSCLASIGYGFLLDDNSVQNLLDALQREKVQRAALESAVTSLRTDVAALNVRHVNCKGFNRNILSNLIN